MKYLKKIGAFVCAALMLCAFAGCAAQPSASAASAASKSSDASDLESDKKLGYQLEMPAEGEEVAVLNTSMGVIKMRLFPEGAPKAVESFKALIEKGYYKGVTFHRIINDFMVQGGDPTGTGAGGESSFGKNFEDEFVPSLVNVRGSVAMANAGPATNGSQFFVNQAKTVSADMWDYYAQATEAYKGSDPDAFLQQYGYSFVDINKATDEYKKLYEKNGGNPGLDGAYNLTGRGHTVFAQVYEGMDVVDKMAAVSTDKNGKPATPVTIDSAELQVYHK